MLVRALETGLAQAAHLQGFHGTREELAELSAATIAADMIRAGRGDEVLKIYASVAPAEGEKDQGKKSWLSETLGKLPGVNGADPARDTTHQDQEQDAAPFAGLGAPDSQSTGREKMPTFTHQVPLLGGGGAQAGPAGGRGDPPGPPHRG